MVDIIHKIVLKELGNIEKDFYAVVMRQGDISEFTEIFDKKLKKIGMEATRCLLEDLDMRIKADPVRKKKWNVERKADENTLLTVFGDVRYSRTYYASKTKKEYKYLSDQLFGIKPHQRVETLVEARIVEEATDTSYEKAAKLFGLSRQKAMNSIRNLEEIRLPEVELTNKRKVEYLYIEADGEYKDNWELWKEVYGYISANYDVDYIKKIYISGDGAPWIKAGVNYIDKSVFVSDRYHLNKYILAATGHVQDMRFKLWDAINRCDKKEIGKLMDEILTCVDSESRAERVKECKPCSISKIK